MGLNESIRDMLSGEVYVQTEDIRECAVTTVKLADSAVTTAKLADCAVTSAKLGLADMLGWVTCAITAGGTSISTYTASGDTTISHLALQITTEASADVCTVSISGGGTGFLIASLVTCSITRQCSGICTLSAGSTITVAMTATTSDEIAGKLHVLRTVFS